jgi:hypothetical protein
MTNDEYALQGCLKSQLWCTYRLCVSELFVIVVVTTVTASTGAGAAVVAAVMHQLLLILLPLL